VQHLGVLRSYLTRHGPGPLPTHDRALDARFAEPHNADEGWQGAFRRGHPDAVLLRYALAAAGRLDGLVVSHLDAVEGADLRWCTGYRATGSASVASLPLSGEPDLDHQHALTRLLQGAEPLYEPNPVGTAQAWVERAEAFSGLPVRFGAFGPTRDTVRVREHIRKTV
jgi:adenylosuccinate synthase